MKLLFCEECSMIFNLARTPRTCDCGKCGGHYLPDGLNAEYFGPAVVFGIDNTSFLRARAMQEVLDHEGYSAAGAPFDAFIIPANAPAIKHVSRKSSGSALIDALQSRIGLLETLLAKSDARFDRCFEDLQSAQDRLLTAPEKKGFLARLFSSN